jgi:DNA polymerase III delta prime subunit
MSASKPKKGRTVSSNPSSPPSVLPLKPALLEHHLHSLEPLLASWRAQKRVPPVLLITGLSGIGKREVATWLAQTFLCEKAGFGAKPQETEGLFGGLFEDTATPAPSPSEARPIACGTCAACHRAIEGHWVDFEEIAAEADEGETGTLKIDQFRELKSTQGFGAFGEGYRITLIRDFDRITVQAANSLLKLLEEPPPGWIFLLTASDVSLLLPTLVSRCQRLRLQPLPPSALEALLAGHELPPDRIPLIAQLAQGSLSRAVRLAQPELWERRELFFRWWSDPLPETQAWLEWAATDEKNLEWLLDTLESALTESLQWCLSEVPPERFSWRQADGARALAKHATRLVASAGGSREKARLQWLNRAEAVFRTRSLSRTPMNRKILVQELLIGFLSQA